MDGDEKGAEALRGHGASTVNGEEAKFILEEYRLGRKEFARIRDLVYELTHIHLHEGKIPLVQHRLSKRLRALGLADFRAYLSYLDENENEIVSMVNAITTNFTVFFREAEHFSFLYEKVLPTMALEDRRRLRFWSAGCATGEEAYSLAMVIREGLADIDSRDVLILATDVSTRALSTAREGVYTKEAIDKCPVDYRRKYLLPAEAGTFRVAPEVARLIRFRRLNLFDPWPMRGPFDVVFCRNVMIYFEKDAKEALVDRFFRILRSGGYLFVGHSESLTGVTHEFVYVMPAVYRKP